MNRTIFPSTPSATPLPPSFPANPQANQTPLFSYERALRAQPAHPLLQHPAVHLASYGLFLSGNVLVLSSMWALGLTGTYLGDYFGILMDAPVTSFPFNVTAAPMYHGSTLSFLGTALWSGKPAGLVLTGLVAVAYAVARTYEV